MAKYKVKNLVTTGDKTVRIYQVSLDGSINQPIDFTTLDIFTKSVGVTLVPGMLIGCVDAPNESQKVGLAGLYEVRIDGTVIIGGGRNYSDVEVVQYFQDNDLPLDDVPAAGYYWTQDEIAEYFNANKEELGVTVDVHYEISCAGAPNRTACLTISGEWDVYVNDRLVATNVTMETVVAELSMEEVVAEKCDIRIPTPESTTHKVANFATYSMEVNGVVHNDLSLSDLKALGASYGLEILGLTEYVQLDEV